MTLQRKTVITYTYKEYVAAGKIRKDKLSALQCLGL